MLSLQDSAEAGLTELASSLSSSAVHWCHQGKLSRSGEAELTGVGHELKRAAEFPIAGRRASAHVEDVGSEGGETLDVSVPWWGFYDSVASFILVLRMTEKETKSGFLTVCWNALLFWRLFQLQKSPMGPLTFS